RRRGGVVVGYRARAGFLFFFSGRRRHTGFSRDWSSDVCSSDLRGAEIQEQIKDPWDRPYIPGSSLKGALRTAIAFVGAAQRQVQIGRASCRERGEVSVAGGAGKEEDGERTDGAADGGGGGCVTR